MCMSVCTRCACVTAPVTFTRKHVKPVTHADTCRRNVFQEGRAGDRAGMKVHASMRRSPAREESERRVDTRMRHIRGTVRL